LTKSAQLLHRRAAALARANPSRGHRPQTAPVLTVRSWRGARHDRNRVSGMRSPDSAPVRA